jgi:hypothetical protein
MRVELRLRPSLSRGKFGACTLEPTLDPLSG